MPAPGLWTLALFSATPLRSLCSPLTAPSPTSLTTENALYAAAHTRDTQKTISRYSCPVGILSGLTASVSRLKITSLALTAEQQYLPHRRRRHPQLTQVARNFCEVCSSRGELFLRKHWVQNLARVTPHFTVGLMIAEEIMRVLWLVLLRNRRLGSWSRLSSVVRWGLYLNSDIGV